MVVNPVFELSMVLSNDKFHKLLSKISDKTDCLEESDEGYIDRLLATSGITVIYRNSQYKKKVKLNVNPQVLLGGNDFDSEKLVRKLCKRIDEYFCKQYSLRDFELSKVVLTADVDVYNRENVSAYLKVLQRIGKIKGFSPVSYDCFDKGTSFCLEGNSNDVEFLTYDLEKALLGHLGTKSRGKKRLRSMLEKTKGVLRAEVRLTTPKAITSYTDTADVVEQISEITDKYKDVFFEVLAQIIPFGDFYKKDKAVEIIRRNVSNCVLRRKMLRLVALIPEKKSLWLAQREMACRDMDAVMKEFAKIDLSPVTISKRHNAKHLNNIYSYFEINSY